MKVLICGSRDFPYTDFLFTFIKGLDKFDTVIVGGARGPDTQAERLARSYQIPVEVYPAPWEEYGKRAGPVRNQQMLDQGKPDMVVAFWDGESRGTHDMIERSRKAGVFTYVVSRVVTLSSTSVEEQDT